MKSQKCPDCGLVNFADAPQCKRCCRALSPQFSAAPGVEAPPFEPAAGAYSPAQTPYPPRAVSSASAAPDSSLLENAGMRRILIGLLWIGGGVAVSYFTYSSAAAGGKYYVFYGAIIYGVIDVLRGIGGLFADD